MPRLFLIVATLAGIALSSPACKDDSGATPASDASPSPSATKPADAAGTPRESACTAVRRAVCGETCAKVAADAMAAASEAQCAGWLQDPALLRALKRSNASETKLAEPCARLTSAVCEVAPTVCSDVRSVVSGGAGTADEAKQCRKILSSPRLMELLVQRLVAVEFAAGRVATEPTSADTKEEP